MIRQFWRAALCLALCTAPVAGYGYPLFGAEDRGIGRVASARVELDAGAKRIAGELLELSEVDLRLLTRKSLDLPPPSPGFSRDIRDLLGDNAERYGVAVLDLSDPSSPRYAESGADTARNPGSVGKIVVAIGFFQALAERYPGDLAARERLLRETVVTADEFIIHDSHKVTFWDRERRQKTRRPLAVGDTGSLWEFLDWMLSASSNAAAAMVMQQALLLTAQPARYPLTPEATTLFFKETPSGELRDWLAKSVQDPLTRNGIDLNRLRQGSFFTRTGKRRVPGTSSYATPRELMRVMLRMEQGRIVDEFSSRELKRLLYMTERRIRYASSPALRDSAVYFKSGSLYRCVPEEGFTCRKYHGNKDNFMNSVAIVETPARGRKLHYAVALTSNVLRRNSAVDHQTLATRIHRLIEKANGFGRE